MIIDADVHISPMMERGVEAGMELTLQRMDKAGVDKALTWLIPPYRREIDEGNAYVSQAAGKYPERFLGFGWADPNLGVEKAKDMVKRCIYEYGFYGVKLNGAQNSFYIDDPVISLPVIEEIAKTGKLLAFHVGADAYEYTHPFRVAKIARMFPEVQILAVHMGGVEYSDVCGAMIEAAKDNPNITLIGSNVRTYPILNAIRELGASRVCFGSDTPFELMNVAVAKYNAMLDGAVDDKEKGLIMSGNIARLFNL